MKILSVWDIYIWHWGVHSFSAFHVPTTPFWRQTLQATKKARLFFHRLKQAFVKKHATPVLMFLFVLLVFLCCASWVLVSTRGYKAYKGSRLYKLYVLWAARSWLLSEDGNACKPVRHEEAPVYWAIWRACAIFCTPEEVRGTEVIAELYSRRMRFQYGWIWQSDPPYQKYKSLRQWRGLYCSALIHLLPLMLLVVKRSGKVNPSTVVRLS